MAIIVVGGIGYILANGFIPVNANHFVFQAPHNVYLKAIRTQNEGYIFALQSIKGGKGPANLGIRNPTITIQKGQLVGIHIINEDNVSPSDQDKHNINIDEFNVHSDDLGYFNTQSILFIADKKGTFDYYCSLHPQMRGTLVVK